MLNYHDIPPNKTAVIFELDAVLIPQKDYDLQVYYLFANFIEYLAAFPSAQEMLSFMTKRYELHGQKDMFSEVSKTFGLDQKYQENLNLLFTNAKLPLKLLLFKEALELLQELIINRKQIFILTGGHPQQQLNKLKQTEWNGLDQYLKVFFVDEFNPKPSNEALEHLIIENNLQKEEVIIIGNQELDRVMAQQSGVDYINMI